jgi:histidine triad (HIT) family protein
VREGCPFCDYDGPSPILHEWAYTITFEPLNPVTPGHLLVVPRDHFADASENPTMTGLVFEFAARLARAFDSYNLITSTGREATQSVKHLHVHVVPRRDGDGLKLPWSAQKADGAP